MEKVQGKPFITLKFYLKIPKNLNLMPIFTTYVKASKFTKYVHTQMNYFQEIFQNGLQKWVSFFLNHPVNG